MGVALIVAVSLMSRSTTQAFSAMVDTLQGLAVLEVTAGEVGFPEELLDVVRDTPGVKRAAPLLLGTAFLADDSGVALALIGVDVIEEREVRSYRAGMVEGMEVDDPLIFLNSPDSVLVTEASRVRGVSRLGIR